MAWAFLLESPPHGEWLAQWVWSDEPISWEWNKCRLEQRLHRWLWRAAHLREREAEDVARLRERSGELASKLAETEQKLKLAEERIKDMGYDMMDMAEQMDD